MNPWDEKSIDWPDLMPGETVVEVGGFNGRWVALMAAKYEARYVVYEPQMWCHERIRTAVQDARPGPRTTLELHPYGLGAEDTVQVLPMGGWGTDVNSFLNTPEWYEKFPTEGRRDPGMGTIKPVAQAFAESRVGEVAVLMMNIEGYEWLLLPKMIDLGCMSKIRHLAVQFHAAHQPLPGAMFAIFEGLKETHDVEWDYGMTLTSWVRR
jgi:FkbM family methyltransferase